MFVQNFSHRSLGAVTRAKIFEHGLLRRRFLAPRSINGLMEVNGRPFREPSRCPSCKGMKKRLLTDPGKLRGREKRRRRAEPPTVLQPEVYCAAEAFVYTVARDDFDLYLLLEPLSDEHFRLYRCHEPEEVQRTIDQTHDSYTYWSTDQRDLRRVDVSYMSKEHDLIFGLQSSSTDCNVQERVIRHF